MPDGASLQKTCLKSKTGKMPMLKMENMNYFKNQAWQVDHYVVGRPKCGDS